MTSTSSDHRATGHVPHRTLRAIAIVATPTLLLAGCDGTTGGALDERRAEVAVRGAEVMPFDLDASLHRFEPTDVGLVQSVTSDDDRQHEPIRQHLGEEAARFSRGDFDDPAAIHGSDMPGLAELRAGAGDLDVTFEELADGARLVFTTEDRALVDALHRWAEAQVSDHGDHAEHVDR